LFLRPHANFQVDRRDDRGRIGIWRPAGIKRLVQRLGVEDDEPGDGPILRLTGATEFKLPERPIRRIVELEAVGLVGKALPVGRHCHRLRFNHRLLSLLG
jgi:hypothetical protein